MKVVDPETAEAETNGSGASSDAPAVSTPAPGPAADETGHSERPTVAMPPAPTPSVALAPKKQPSIGSVRPNALLVLAVLGVLTALSIIGGLVFGDTALGKTCVIGLVPTFSLVFGIVATHWYSKRGLDEELASAVQTATYTTLQLKRSVEYADDCLGAAQSLLENKRSFSALLEVVRAKTATELSLGTAQQSSRQWESISKSGAQAAQSWFVEDDDEWRPRIREGSDPKTVAPGGDETVGEDGEDA